jgi:hypothetical protein
MIGLFCSGPGSVEAGLLLPLTKQFASTNPYSVVWVIRPRRLFEKVVNLSKCIMEWQALYTLYRKKKRGYVNVIFQWTGDGFMARDDISWVIDPDGFPNLWR